MAAKKPVRAPRSAPARTPSKPAAAPPAASPDGTILLVFHGGATLSFRDGSGAKRRALRGVPFSTDAATAELLLATDPTVTPAEPDPAPVTSLVTGTAVVPVLAVEPAPVAPAEAVTSPPPEVAPPAPGPGAITLGDLPPSARIGRP